MGSIKFGVHNIPWNSFLRRDTFKLQLSSVISSTLIYEEKKMDVKLKFLISRYIYIYIYIYNFKLISSKLCFRLVRTVFIFNDNKLSNFNFPKIFSSLIFILHASFDKPVTVNFLGVCFTNGWGLSIYLCPLNHSTFQDIH